MPQTPLKKRTPPPVASFGPEVMATLLKGARTSFEVPLPTYRMAVTFAARINALRSAMEREAHPAYSLVKKAKVRILWGPDGGYPEVKSWKNSRGVAFPEDRNVPAKLVVEPHDSVFASALKSAGITPAELQDDVLTQFDATPEPENKGSDFLDQFETKPPVETSKKPPGV